VFGAFLNLHASVGNGGTLGDALTRRPDPREVFYLQPSSPDRARTMPAPLAAPTRHAGPAMGGAPTG
jgi:hypothetical protein